MTETLKNCRELLKNKSYACVIGKDGEIRTSSHNGIRPLIDWLEEGKAALSNASVADRVVGKAAALLMLYGGVIEVFAEIISEPAAACLAANHIPFTYEQKVSHILNRTRTGGCPMEQACLSVDSPEQAYKILKEKLNFMKKA